MAWGRMEMPCPWIRIPETTEAPIHYLEAAGAEQGSKVQRAVAHTGRLAVLRTGIAFEAPASARTIGGAPWGGAGSLRLYAVMQVSTVV